MSEKRNMTKEDIFLEARLRSEGARIDVKKKSKTGAAFRPVVMDGCELVVGLWPNPYSRLEVVIDGDDVMIADMGEVLGRGTLEPRPPWRHKALGDGTLADAYFGNADIATLFLSNRCALFDAGKGCKYCALYAGRSPMNMTESALETSQARCIEAAAIAMQDGWRGTILFSGGMRPKPLRGQVTGTIERIMDRFREAVGDEVLSEMHVAMGTSFPPDDLNDLHRWKEMGVNSTELDSQVMDKAYFEAICPGRGDQGHWLEAQAASAEVFGRGRGATTGVVMGVEPMAGLLEGVEERVEKGIFTQLFTFVPAPGSALEGMRPPTADWIVEASEKIADIYMRYADTFEVDLTEDTRFGYTRKGRSFYMSPVDDEMARRLQEMGKLGPGLPTQGG